MWADPLVLRVVLSRFSGGWLSRYDLLSRSVRYEPRAEHLAPQLCATTVKLLAAAIKISEMLDFVGSAAAY